MKIYKPTLIAPDDPPIVDADVSAAAAITRTKLAAGTANRLVVNVPTTGVIGEAAAITATRALVSDANGIPAAANPTTTEINYVAGVTSLIQTQLNTITAIPRREVLTAARTYYVRTDGSDANTGLVDSAGGAFLTIQKGVDTCYTIDQNGFNATVQVGAGTYTTGATVTKAFTGPVILSGDATTPSNVLISVTNAQAIYVGNKGELQIRGFKIVVATAGQAFQALFGGKITLTGLMDFGACANVHMYSAYDAQIIVAAPYNITGGAQYHQLATFKSMIYCIGQTITLTGTPAFSNAFAGAQQCSYFQGNGNTYVGSATGPRFDVRQLSMLSSAGGGASYFPGNSVGVTDAATFGVYN